MRIAEISIDGFGVFCDVDVTDLPQGLSIFLGDNEAGKSTTLAFVNTVLFGYPDARTKEKAYPPLNGGQPGGRLVLETESAGRLTVERVDGKKGGPITITYADGHYEGQAALSGLLSGTTRNLYRNLYAFSLHELERMESVSNDEVRDVIYGASLGSGSRSFPDARKRLQNRMDELFRPRASTSEMNIVLKALEDVRQKLHDASKGIKEYQELAASLATMELGIGGLREVLGTERERYELLKNRVQLWDDWTALQDTESRLAELPIKVESFPENGLDRIDALLAKIEQEKSELSVSDGNLKEKRDLLGRAVFDEVFIEKEPQIRALVRRVATFEQAVTEIPRAEERSSSADRQAEEVVAEFGDGWTEERVLALDRSSVIHSYIEGQAKALELARRSVEKASDTETNIRLTVDEATATLEKAHEDVEKLQFGHVDIARDTLAALREGRPRFQDVIRDIPRTEIQRSDAVASLDDLLREINPAWKTETLEQFDPSLTARQNVADIDARLTRLDAEQRDANNEIKRADNRLAETESAITAKLKDIEDAASTETSLEHLGERKKSVRSLRNDLSRRETVRARLEATKQMSQIFSPTPVNGSEGSLGRRLRTLAIAAGLLAVVVGPALWFGVDPRVGATTGGVLFLVAIIVFVLSRTDNAAPARSKLSPDADTKSLKQLEDELTDIESAIETAKSEHGIAGAITAADIDRLDDEIAEQMSVTQDLARLRRDLKNLEQNRGRASDVSQIAIDNAANAKSQFESAATDWDSLAHSLRLPTATSPRTAGLVFEKTETARGQAQQIANFELRLTEMQSARDEYLTLMTEAPSLKTIAEKGDDPQCLTKLAEFLAEMERQDENMQLLADARRKSETADQQLAAEKVKLESASAEHRSLVQKEEEIQAAWFAWRKDHGMNESWSPGICIRLLDRAGRLAELKGNRDDATATLERLEREKHDYIDGVANLCSALGRERPADDKWVSEVHALESTLEEYKKQQTIHRGLSNEIPTLESRCDTRDQQIKTLKAEIQELIEAGGANDEDEFRRRGRTFDQIQALESDITTHRSNVKKLSGQGNLQALRDELREMTLPGLRVEQAAVGERVTEMASNLDELQEAHTRTDERCKNLINADTIVRLRAKEESLLESFQVYADDWARHAVALHLLEVAKERFEKDHQPEVIQHASSYFSSITHGRYKQVFAPHGEEAIEVIDARERRKAVETLSRGTSEQLYLAIRFGYIASRDGHGEKLPLMMDDVLVNFDPTRASHAAKGILKMAETHQILFFTCHPEMVNVFQRHSPEIPVYMVDKVQIRIAKG